MSKSITLTFKEIPEGMTDREILFAVQDAVCEFWANRNPVEEYIAKRYGTHDNEFRVAKFHSVSKRVALMENVDLGDVITKED